MSEELEVLKLVTHRLAAAGIPYMVTGSMAVNYYAVPRMTRDIDVVVELSPQDTDRICALFQDDFYLDREAVQQSIEKKGMFNLIHNTLVVKVDVVVRKDTDYRRAEFLRRRRASVEGHEFFIVAPEDLIISKLDWARDTRSEVQLADVRNLVECVTGLDRACLAHLDQSPGARFPLRRGQRMNDTSPEVERIFRRMLLQRSGEERMRMGCSMHATAQALVRASVLEKDPQASPTALRQALFLRFYGHEFDPEAREKIFLALKTVPLNGYREKTTA